MKIISLGIRFMLEICILISIAYWGFQTGKGQIMKILLCFFTPTIIAIIWGVFLSPKANLKLPFIGFLTLELIIFGIAALALYTTGHHKLAISFSVISIINISILHIFKY